MEGTKKLLHLTTSVLKGMRDLTSLIAPGQNLEFIPPITRKISKKKTAVSDPFLEPNPSGKSKGFMWDSCAIFDTPSFTAKYMRLCEFTKDYSDYIKSLGLEERHVRWAKSFFTMYLKHNKESDLGLEDVASKLSEICYNFHIETSCKNIMKNATKVKYVKSIKNHLITYLAQKTFEVQFNIDVHALEVSLSDLITTILNDEKNDVGLNNKVTKKMTNEIRSENSPVSFEEIASFLHCPYFVKWFEAMEKLIELDDINLFVQQFVEYSPMPGTAIDLRNLIMLLFVICTGRRPQEVISLRLGDFQQRQELEKLMMIPCCTNKKPSKIEVRNV